MNIWIITDTHFNHKDIITEFGFRPVGFEEIILKNIKKTVSKNDLLIHLGDFSFGDDAYWQKRFNDEIDCVKWFILGNHDKHSMVWYFKFGWYFVGETFSLNMYGHKILFSHEPQIDSGYTINIHGHFHNNDHRLHESNLVAIKNDKQYLLALEDNNYQLFNLHAIIKKFDTIQRQSSLIDS